jgi:hypothetical protein
MEADARVAKLGQKARHPHYNAPPVATFNGPTMMARIGVMRALNRHAMSLVADSFA